MSFQVKVNSQLSNLEESATLVINQKVKDLRASGENVVHFGFGQSPFPIHQSIQDALCRNADKKMYLPTKGLPELQVAISEFIQKHFGYSYPSKNIIIGPGSKQLLYQATAVLEGPFILPAPSWVSYGPQAELLGKHIVVVQTELKNDYKLTAEQLDSAASSLDHRQKLLILNNPSNPTGAVYSSGELKEIAQVCRENQIIVLSDEIYAHICFDSDRAAGLPELYPEGTIVSGGLSKAFNGGGYRLGFIAVPENMNEVVQALAVMSSETYTSVSAPIQYAAIEAFTNPAVVGYAKDCRDIHQATSKYLYSKFKELKLSCPEPKGAFYLFPSFENYREKLKAGGIRNSKKLCQDILQKKKVAMLPSGSFYCTGESLGCRVATVDYDGAAVYQAYLKAKQEKLSLDEKFVKTHCPQLEMGVLRLQEYLQAL